MKRLLQNTLQISADQAPSQQVSIHSNKLFFFNLLQRVHVRYIPACSANAAALNWYRANVQLEQFGDTKPRPAPLICCPVLGVWSTKDFGVLEEQMKGSGR